MLKRVKKIFLSALVVLMIVQLNTLLFATKASAEYSDRGYFKYAQEEPEENEHWSKFPVPRISKDFTEEERLKIWQALEKAQDRILTQEVADCISNNVTYGYYRDETPIQAAQRFAIRTQTMVIREGQSRVNLKERRQRLYINSGNYYDGKSEDVAGYADYAKVRASEQDINIYLVRKTIDTHDSDFWAGAIVHEILHTYTYAHPEYDKKKDLVTQFKGNIVFEVGWCVSKHGNEFDFDPDFEFIN
jgi:hypothetical protein